MARPSFSVRFPADLAEALDRIAEYHGQSRSDVVETLIKGLDSDDRDMVLKTTVAGAPTKKLNLRLSADTLTRLKQLSADLEPADFLRRTLAYVVAMAPPDWHAASAPQGNGHEPSAARARRRVHRDHVNDAEVVAAVQAGSAGRALFAIVLIGALITLIVWLIWRKTDPDSGPLDDPRGQLPPGPTQTGGA
jgi:predicted DNA-binding protein